VPAAGHKRRTRCTANGCRKLAPAGRKRCDDHKPGAGKPAKEPGKLYGCTNPRLFTPPLRPLTANTSLGYEIIQFAEMIGHPLYPWQEQAVIRSMELLPDGSFRFRIIVILVARQNGKSHLKRIVSLWRMFMYPGSTILGVAQELSLAREQMLFSLDAVRGFPEMAAELEHHHKVNGDEWFRIGNGSRYKIAATNRSAGRGLSVDELTFDEMREQRNSDAWNALFHTTMARPNSQIWAMSNAGDDQSQLLNRLRESALSGADPTIGLFEWSAPDGCDLDDISGWQQANPSMGYKMSEASIRTARHADRPQDFRTEVLCQRVEQLDGAIDLAAWRDCSDAGGSLEAYRSRLAACFDIAPDGQHATLVVAAMLPDGRPRVQVAAAWKSTEDARAELPGLLDKMKPLAIGWYPTGPGGAFAAMLRRRPGSTELSGGKVAEACQGFADLAGARQIVHAGEMILDEHIKGAIKVTSGDGYRFARRGVGHVDAAYAAAGAVYVAQNMDEPPRARIRILG
jgi:hypothetical protein